ncbi:MAG: GSCFA domain-containing protein [Cyclobacteriaceae bacterium]
MFTLPFQIPKSSSKIGLSDSIFSMGSCFAENMSHLLLENKFKALANPFGTIYNPHSIFKVIRTVLSSDFNADAIIENSGVYYHWDAHSEVSETNLSRLKSRLLETSKTARAQLLASHWLIITLGTAKVYSLRSSNEIVANCHKIPQKQFDSRLMTEMEIVESFESTHHLIKKHNPNINIILTVSPVRHIRDGLVENNMSKGVLLNAVNRITSAHSNIHYFPAYELMIDVLRDYRFYKRDMIHPSDHAVEYIWDRFCETYLDEQSISFLGKWDKIKRALNHKAFHPKSEAHQRFLKEIKSQLVSLTSQIDIEKELAIIEKQLDQ